MQRIQHLTDMPRLDKELSEGESDAESASQRVEARRAGIYDCDIGLCACADGISTGDSAGDQDLVADNQQDMNYEANDELYRMNLQAQGDNQLNGLQPQYSREQRTMPSIRFQDEMNRARNLQDERYEVEPTLYRWRLANTSLRVPEEQENTDSSRDTSTDNGESSGNSHEGAQQWSDTEDTNRSVPMETNDENQGEAPCRVSWCEQVGKRYGLCWAHGGVKKCCHHNCPKIALETGEFCSIHDRQISTSTF